MTPRCRGAPNKGPSTRPGPSTSNRNLVKPTNTPSPRPPKRRPRFDAKSIPLAPLRSSGLLQISHVGAAFRREQIHCQTTLYDHLAHSARTAGERLAARKSTLPSLFVTSGAVPLVSPRAKAWQRRKSACKSSLPVSFARTLLAMFSRLLARWLCFRLSDQLIAAGYALVTAGRSGVSIMGRSWAVLMVVRCRTRVTGL